jgi:sugar phosphate isomerase/epimerase
VDLFAALERCLPRLAEVHLHDGPWQGPEERIGYGKDHQPLGTGGLDVPRLLDRLTAAHFDGPIILELRLEQALVSLQLIRAIWPKAVKTAFEQADTMIPYGGRRILASTSEV